EICRNAVNYFAIADRGGSARLGSSTICRSAVPVDRLGRRLLCAGIEIRNAWQAALPRLLLYTDATSAVRVWRMDGGRGRDVGIGPVTIRASDDAAGCASFSPHSTAHMQPDSRIIGDAPVRR